jgi:hypothetical protein
VERAGHDPIGGVERLLDAVTVVDVDIDVENALVVSQKLENPEDDVCKQSQSM